MAKKDFLVVGLGQFGMSVAKTLAKQGCGVITMDKDPVKTQEIADEVEYAVTSDATDAEVMENLGVSGLDGAIIAITNNMEASIMATIIAKELGVPQVIVKASSDIHRKIALKVGADHVIFPEKEMGERTARNLTAGNFVDLVELSPNISIVEMPVKEDWIGKSIVDIGFREKYAVNIIAVQTGDDIDVAPNPRTPLKEGQVLMVIASYKALARIGAR